MNYYPKTIEPMGVGELKLRVSSTADELLQKYTERAVEVYGEKVSSDELRLDAPDLKKHADFHKALNTLRATADSSYDIAPAEAHAVTANFEKALRAFGKEEIDPELSKINSKLKDLDALTHKGADFDRSLQHLEGVEAKGTPINRENAKTMESLAEQVKAVSSGLEGRVSKVESLSAYPETVTPPNTPNNSRPSTPSIGA